MERSKIDRVTLSAYIVSIILGGLNAIGVHYIVLELPPFWGATLRYAPAALLLFSLSAILKLPLPRGRSLVGAILFGIFSFGMSVAFLYTGLQKVQPGMVSVILALAPIITLFLASFQRQEKFRWGALFGALISLGGIALVFRQELLAKVPLFSLLAVVIGVASLSEGNLIAKMIPKNNPIMTNAVGMTVGTVILFVMTLLWHEPMALPKRGSTWIALVYLILLGSCTIFTLTLFMLKRWSASTISYQFVMLPFVTITISNLLMHEKFSLILLAGAALVLSGVFIGIYNSRIKNFLVQTGLPSAPIPISKGLFGKPLAGTHVKK